MAEYHTGKAESKGDRYRATCSCGWSGRWSDGTRSKVEWALHGHLSDVGAVPVFKPGDLVRGIHDHDSWALWEVLEIVGDRLRVRIHGSDSPTWSLSAHPNGFAHAEFPK